MLPWQPFLAFYIWGAHWRHLKNTTEPSILLLPLVVIIITVQTIQCVRGGLMFIWEQCMMETSVDSEVHMKGLWTAAASGSLTMSEWFWRASLSNKMMALFQVLSLTELCVLCLFSDFRYCLWSKGPNERLVRGRTCRMDCCSCNMMSRVSHGCIAHTNVTGHQHFILLISFLSLFW